MTAADKLRERLAKLVTDDVSAVQAGVAWLNAESERVRGDHG